MNRWSQGDRDPWSNADWTLSWIRGVVNDQEWAESRRALGVEARQWLAALATSREYTETELNSVMGSIAHLAYHFGAIRQMDRSIGGPLAS